MRSLWRAQEICPCRYGQPSKRLLFDSNFVEMNVLGPMQFDIKNSRTREPHDGAYHRKNLRLSENMKEKVEVKPSANVLTDELRETFIGVDDELSKLL